LKLNVERLKEYKERLIVFPRKLKKVKGGDSDKAATSDAQQLKGELVAAPATESALSYVTITDVSNYYCMNFTISFRS
jgi:large subunit ribosomal protein L13e